MKHTAEALLLKKNENKLLRCKISNFLLKITLIILCRSLFVSKVIFQEISCKGNCFIVDLNIYIIIYIIYIIIYIYSNIFYIYYIYISHSGTLAWKIPWKEEPGRLQSMGSLGVRHD